MADADAVPRATPRIAFLGLGVMGGAMLRNLVKHGFEVVGYDVNPAALDRLADVACRRASSPADAARGAQIVITMLPTSAHVRDALFGADGAAAALPPGALVIEMSTGDAVETDRLGADLAQMQLRCIDAPVGRTPREAAEGKALIMAGAALSDLEEARLVFGAMADTIVHVGPFGSGIRLKLVNNYLGMVGMVLTGEALMFAAKLGLDRDIVVKVMSSTAAGRGQLNTNFPRKVLAGDITPDFPLRMGFKDINLAMNLAASIGAPLGLGGYAREMFALAKSWGREEQDCTAMLLLLEDIANLDRGACRRIMRKIFTPDELEVVKVRRVGEVYFRLEHPLERAAVLFQNFPECVQAVPRLRHDQRRAGFAEALVDRDRVTLCVDRINRRRENVIAGPHRPRRRH